MKNLQQKLNTSVIYVRVSTTKQAEQGFSLIDQEKKCIALAKARGLTILKIFRESGQSAKNTDRDALKEMMRFIALNKNKIGYLIIYKVDRLARNNNDYYQLKLFLKSYGVELLSKSEKLANDPAGKFMEAMLAGIAEFDNGVRTERTIGGMQEALRSGYWVFKSPFGYKNSMLGKKKKKFEHAELLVNEETAPVVRMVFEEYSRQIYTFLELSKKINRVTNGKYRMSPQNVVKILHNHLYYGWINVPAWNIFVRGNHKPIISKELFDKAQLVLAGGNPRKMRRNRYHPDFPLRGVQSGLCHNNMTGGWTTGKMGVKYGYYDCVKKDCGLCKPVRKEIFEQEFTKFLESLVPKQKDLEILAESIKLQFKQETGLLVQNNTGVEKQIAELKKQKENLLAMKLKDSSIISDEDFKEHNKKLDNQLINLEQALVSPDVSRFDVNSAIDFACELIKNLPKLWQHFEIIMVMTTGIFSNSLGRVSFEILRVYNDVRRHTRRDSFLPLFFELRVGRADGVCAETIFGAQALLRLPTIPLVCHRSIGA